MLIYSVNLEIARKYFLGKDDPADTVDLLCGAEISKNRFLKAVDLRFLIRHLKMQVSFGC